MKVPDVKKRQKLNDKEEKSGAQPAGDEEVDEYAPEDDESSDKGDDFNMDDYQKWRKDNM